MLSACLLNAESTGEPWGTVQGLWEGNRDPERAEGRQVGHLPAGLQVWASSWERGRKPTDGLGGEETREEGTGTSMGSCLGTQRWRDSKRREAS